MISPIAIRCADENCSGEGIHLVDTIHISVNHSEVGLENENVERRNSGPITHTKMSTKMASNFTSQNKPSVADSTDAFSMSDNSASKKLSLKLGVESSGLDLLCDQFEMIPSKLKPEKVWNVRSNPRLTASVNPIRQITDGLVLDDTNQKQFISLAQGDPAQFGPHMKVPEVATLALANVVLAGNNNGYAMSNGLPECRTAVADYLSSSLDCKISPQEVIMTSGCGQAVQHSIDVLRFLGCNILLPRPGFPLYETYCAYFGVEVRHYNVQEDRDWQVDLVHAAALTDANTAAMIICNPGNPSGSVFSYDHLAEIATFAEAFKVPIIADEVYASLVFGKNPFVSMALFSSQVPVIALGGISKNWLAPGWRLGWLSVWDPRGILRKARVFEAFTKVMQITLGPSTLIQAAVPHLLRSTPATFFEETLGYLRQGADLCYTRANSIYGLDCPSRPQGSMFMLIRLNLSLFKGITNDVEFSSALLKEESVLVLPGTAFGCPNRIRIVFALTWAEQNEAWNRIEEFCRRYTLKP